MSLYIKTVSFPVWPPSNSTTRTTFHSAATLDADDNVALREAKPPRHNRTTRNLTKIVYQSLIRANLWNKQIISLVLIKLLDRKHGNWIITIFFPLFDVRRSLSLQDFFFRFLFGWFIAFDSILLQILTSLSLVPHIRNRSKVVQSSSTSFHFEFEPFHFSIKQQFVDFGGNDVKFQIMTN